MNYKRCKFRRATTRGNAQSKNTARESRKLCLGTRPTFGVARCSVTTQFGPSTGIPYGKNLMLAQSYSNACTVSTRRQVEAARTSSHPYNFQKPVSGRLRPVPREPPPDGSHSSTRCSADGTATPRHDVRTSLASAAADSVSGSFDPSSGVPDSLPQKIFPNVRFLEQKISWNYSPSL